MIIRHRRKSYSAAIGLCAALAILILPSSGATAAVLNNMSGQPRAAQTTLPFVSVALPFNTAQGVPLYEGFESGIYKRNHIDVKVNVLSASALVSALLTGGVDIAFGGPDLAQGIVATKAAKVIFSNGPSILYLVAKPGMVTTPCQGLKCTQAQTDANLQQISAKKATIGATAPGSETDSSVRLALAGVGRPIGASEGASVAYLGTTPSILAAVIAGKVQVGVEALPIVVKAQQSGLQIIATLTKWSTNSVWAINSTWATRHKAVAIRFVKSFCAATHLAIHSRVYAEAALRDYVNITDPTQLAATWAAFKSAWACEAYTPAAMKFSFNTLSPVPAVKPQSIIDNKYIDAVGKKNWVVVNK